MNFEKMPSYMMLILTMFIAIDKVSLVTTFTVSVVILSTKNTPPKEMS
jgi:hypothetical protein